MSTPNEYSSERSQEEWIRRGLQDSLRQFLAMVQAAHKLAGHNNLNTGNIVGAAHSRSSEAPSPLAAIDVEQVLTLTRAIAPLVGVEVDDSPAPAAYMLSSPIENNETQVESENPQTPYQHELESIRQELALFTAPTCMACLEADDETKHVDTNESGTTKSQADEEATELIPLPCGTHHLCHDCCRSMFKSAFQSGFGHPFPPYCCGVRFPTWYIDSYTPPETRREYHLRAEEFATPYNKRVYCSICDTFCNYEQGKDSRAFCYECQEYTTCVQCKRPVDGCICGKEMGELSKEEMEKMEKDKEEDQLLMELAQEMLWIRCPQCGIMVERIEGCFHMICRCGAEFCYFCGEMYENCGCRDSDLVDSDDDSDSDSSGSSDGEEDDTGVQRDDGEAAWGHQWSTGYDDEEYDDDDDDKEDNDDEGNDAIEDHQTPPDFEDDEYGDEAIVETQDFDRWLTNYFDDTEHLDASLLSPAELEPDAENENGTSDLDGDIQMSDSPPPPPPPPEADTFRLEIPFIDDDEIT